jgi:hypothetical protein
MSNSKGGVNMDSDRRPTGSITTTTTTTTTAPDRATTTLCTDQQRESIDRAPSHASLVALAV